MDRPLARIDHGFTGTGTRATPHTHRGQRGEETQPRNAGHWGTLGMLIGVWQNSSHVMD